MGVTVVLFRVELILSQQFSHIKGPLTWSIFNPGVELSPVDRVEISALPVTQNSIKIKRAITWQSFQPRAEFNPGVEISTLLQLAGLKFQPWVELSPGSISILISISYSLGSNNSVLFSLLKINK